MAIPSTSNCSLSGLCQRFWLGVLWGGEILSGLLNSWQALYLCVCVCVGQNEVVCRFNFAGESGRREELFQYPLSLDVDAQLGNVSKQEWQLEEWGGQRGVAGAQTCREAYCKHKPQK